LRRINQDFLYKFEKLENFNNLNRKRPTTNQVNFDLKNMENDNNNKNNSKQEHSSSSQFVDHNNCYFKTNRFPNQFQFSSYEHRSELDSINDFDVFKVLNFFFNLN
jgi:hypothetical protein